MNMSKPMTISARLRHIASGLVPAFESEIMREGADRIDALEAECTRLAQRNTMLISELGDRGRRFTPEQLKAAIVKSLYEGEG